MDYKSLVEHLNSALNCDSSETESMLSAMTEVVKEAACNLDSVSFPGFGCFEPKKRLERISVNPATGKRLLLPPKITLTFRPSVMLRQKVRNNIDKIL